MQKLIIPEKELEEGWYEQYPKLNSNLFTYGNSARKASMAHFYLLKDGKLVPNKYCKSNAEDFTILGYTLNPPMTTHDGDVAIMFEHKESFKKVWFHYSRYDI